MTTWVVGEGGNFTTIAQVLAAVQPGDVVELLTGVYKDALKIVKANTTWRAVAGNTPVLDGSYSHEWAKKSGTSWRDLVYRSPAGGTSGSVVTVAADGVTIEGLTIRNAGAAGIGAGAVDGLTVRNCLIEFCYDTCIVVNGAAGGDATNVLIEGNTCRFSSVKKFDPGRASGGSPQAVSGNVKVTGRGIIVRGNTVSQGHGEGINIGKDAFDVLVEGNVVYDTAHLGIYVNRGRDVVVRNNIVFFTGDPAYLYTDNEAPCGMGLRDEETAKGTWITSSNVSFLNNTVVNAGYAFLLNPEKPTSGLEVMGNTFVAGPLTRKGIAFANAQGAIFEDNTVHAPDDLLVATVPAGALCRVNRWSSMPPSPWQGPGDVYGPLGLKGVDVLPTAEHEPFGMGRAYSIDPDNYRPGEVVEPPDEPPIVLGAVTLKELDAIAEQLAVAGLAVDEAMAQIDALRERLTEPVG